MLTESAEQTLSTLKQILQDIDLVAGQGAGEKVIACIKNTMSDQHIVQKIFNCLLEDHRSQISPSVTSNWATLYQKSNRLKWLLSITFLWHALDSRYG